MILEETKAQKDLRRELRTYYKALLTREVQKELKEQNNSGKIWREVVKQMGKDGWLGIGWPKKYGGLGRPATDQFIFFDETRRANAPFPFVTINTVGPTIIEYGSQEMKDYYLEKILSGEINFAIGYTEPEAGTDLASLTTKAKADGDEYVINGNKIYTSGANDADYIWLAARTGEKGHKGISIFCVPTTTNGFSYTLIKTVGGMSTTATYYEDVRVGKDTLVGEEGNGWAMITTQLNHERVGLAAWAGIGQELFTDVVTWARETSLENGKNIIDLPWVQTDLAICKAELEAMWLLNWKMAVAVARDEVTAADSSTVKVFGTERLVEINRLLQGILGTPCYQRADEKRALLGARLEENGRQAQINTFGGGVNEVQREIIAMAGLKMKRTRR